MIKKIRSLLSSSTTQDTAISMVGNAGVALFGMIFTIIVARGLAPENFGLLSALIALGILIASLGDAGLSAALVNFLPKFKSNRHELISTTFWSQLAVAGVAVIVVFILSFFRNTIIPGSQFIHYAILAVFSFLSIFSAFAQSVFRAERRFFWSSLLQWIETGSKLIIIIPIFLIGSLTIVISLAASAASVALSSAIGISKEMSHIRPIFPKHHFKEIFDFTKWIAVMRIFSVAVSRIDVILLSSLASNYQAGLFAAASRVAMLFAIIVSSLGSVVAPRFSSFTKVSQTKTYLKKLTLLIAGVSVLMATTILAAPLIVNLVFGPEYIEAIPVFRYLTLAMIPFLFSIVTINPLIYAFNKPDFVSKATIFQVILLVILDLYFIPKFGAIGPTISLAISNTAVLGITGWKLKTLLS